MKVVNFILFLILIFLVLTLNLYWIIPSQDLEFDGVFTKGSSEFSLVNGSQEEILFYDNIRFQNKEISYSIDEDCSISKKEEMREAFDIIENLTVLDFYPSNEGKISVSCQEKRIIEEGMFIAGEGGPTQIIQSGKYSIILSGSILLIRDSDCAKPQVAIHELLHVIGFNHSENKGNIMYPYSKCTQEIGEEIPLVIEGLYSDPSLPDLAFEEINASVKSGRLGFNLTMRNIGIVDAPENVLKIYADDKEIKSYPMGELEAGTGLKLSSTNIPVRKFRVEKITFEIQTNFEELDKENNKKELVAMEN